MLRKRRTLVPLKNISLRFDLKNSPPWLDARTVAVAIARYHINRPKIYRICGEASALYKLLRSDFEQEPWWAFNLYYAEPHALRYIQEFTLK